MNGDGSGDGGRCELRLLQPMKPDSAPSPVQVPSALRIPCATIYTRLSALSTPASSSCGLWPLRHGLQQSTGMQGRAQDQVGDGRPCGGGGGRDGAHAAAAARAVQPPPLWRRARGRPRAGYQRARRALPGQLQRARPQRGVAAGEAGGNGAAAAVRGGARRDAQRAGARRQRAGRGVRIAYPKPSCDVLRRPYGQACPAQRVPHTMQPSGARILHSLQVCSVLGVVWASRCQATPRTSGK